MVNLWTSVPNGNDTIIILYDCVCSVHFNKINSHENVIAKAVLNSSYSAFYNMVLREY